MTIDLTLDFLINTLMLDPDTPILVQPVDGDPVLMDLNDLLANPDLLLASGLLDDFLDGSGLLDDLDLQNPGPGGDPEPSVIRRLVDLAYPDGDEPAQIDLNAVATMFPELVDELEDYFGLPEADRDPLDPDWAFLGGTTGVAQVGDIDQVIFGSIFGDALSGLGGDDRISGLNWADALDGGTGNDSIFGGNGDDLIKGGAGRDVLRGDEGSDDMRGGGGRDKMFGGTEDDEMRGDGGGDKLKGQDGNDILSGGAGRDKLNGGKDDDMLDGGNGNDLMKGGSGDDTIVLGNGEDRAIGGAGADTFIFDAAAMDGVDRIIIDAEDSFALDGFGAATALNATETMGADEVHLSIGGELVAIVTTDMTPQQVIDLFDL